jgi:D-glycero-D-manno-heptose 1,7-bisphosphate phosphatase
MTAIRRAVFLDRDGTLNVKAPEGEYITSPEDLDLLPGVAGAVHRLNEAGLFVAVVTNQRGIARGMLSLDAHAEIMVRLAALLAECDAHLDAVYVCPHEIGTCDCRKPAPGLLLRAAGEHPDLDLRRSTIVGDAESDVEAGRRAGTQTIRLSATPVLSRADHVASDLAAATSLVIGADNQDSTGWDSLAQVS